MSKLLAPNGKPSNLNAKQYKLVRTPAFKKWFGDWENDPANASKVVDSNGEPLVVYHGTKSWDIYEFDLSKSKRISSGLKEFGTYFTDNKKLAESYRDWSDLKKEEITDIDKEIYKWEEILYKTRNNRDYDYAEQQIKALKELKKGKIYGVFLNLKKMYSFDAKKETNIEAWNNLEVKASYKLARNRDAMDFLKEGKFGVEKVDGIQAKNIVDAFVQTEELKKELLSNVYLVFDSKNIKLADGTNTAFDGNNPDIRFNDGGEVEKIKLLFIENGFTEDDLDFIIEENPNYFNKIEFLNENTIIVYRTLLLPRGLADKFIQLDKKEIGDGIGEYWTLNKELKSAIWGEGQYDEETYLIQCKGNLKISDIDWEMMKYAFNDDAYNFTSESEIRGLNGGNSIKVIECQEIIYSNGGEVKTGLFSQIWEWFGIKF